MCPDHSYIMLNLDWNQRKMQEKNIFQIVPEHEKHRLLRAFVDVEWLCSRVEPQKEARKLSLVLIRSDHNTQKQTFDMNITLQNGHFKVKLLNKDVPNEELNILIKYIH